jgi:hypothetical protein
MAYYKFTLKAGVAMPVNVAGRYILVDDLGVAQGVDIMPNYGGRDLPNMPDRKKAFKFAEPYDGLTLRAAVDCVVSLFLTTSDVSLGFSDGSQVAVSGGSLTIANDAAHRVPVDIAGGTVNVTAGNVTVNNNLTTLTHAAPVAVGIAATPVISDATQKRLRFRNADPAAVIVLGGAGVTLASGVIVLNPGDIWNEVDAPGAAWFAISDTANASLQVMGVK